jgi:hypothetical protein
MASPSSPLRKLPPAVARELRRHVSPRPLKSPSEQLRELREERWSGAQYALGGCMALLTAAASFPLLATWWISLNDKEGALTKAQIRRGAFNNSGSTDVGRDPDWDFSTGQYRKPVGYQAVLDQERESRGRPALPPEFHASSSPGAIDKHEKKMLDFAHGRAKNDG